MSASESRLRDAAGTQVAGEGSQYSPLQAYRDELAGFCNTIRNNAPNLCTGEEAMNACSPIIRANDSIARREKLDIPPQLYATT